MRRRQTPPPLRQALMRCSAGALALAVMAQVRPAIAHPHVFVDTTIGVVVGADGALEALEIVWRFDPFHTLYSLSFDGIAPTAEGGLDAAAQAQLVRAYTNWQPGFDGFAKLSLGGKPVALGAPAGATARLLDGQLEISFTRAVAAPVALGATTVEIAVYDASYYHAVSVSAAPELRGSATGCDATLVPFKPDAQPPSVGAALSQLEREETPPTANIGARFADRITLSCA